MSGLPIAVTVLEAAHLADLIGQFLELLDAPGATADPAVARLVPDAYRGDASAAQEFRRLTEGDLLAARRHDAETVRNALRENGRPLRIDGLDMAAAGRHLALSLDADAVRAWLRTLTALRLVLADRLGIVTDADGDPADPQYQVYEWVGYRLETLLQAIDA